LNLEEDDFIPLTTDPTLLSYINKSEGQRFRAADFQEVLLLKDKSRTRAIVTFKQLDNPSA